MKAILIVGLIVLVTAVIDCPNISCKDLSEIDDQYDEDTLCYMHDSLDPVEDITSWPCPEGYTCEISWFEDEYAFIDAEEQMGVPASPLDS